MTIIPQRPLTDAARLDWLRLARTENIGPITFFRLLTLYKDAARAIEALPELARRGGKTSATAVPSRMTAEKEVEALHRFGGRFVAACEPDYPTLLAGIADPPPVISVAGNIDLLNKPTVGIVGARNASLNGQRFTEKLAVDLGAAGVSGVSGLARGIDTAAHKGSLNSGTVAVVAGGIDVVYPPENRKLFDEIKARGLIVAESAFGAEPQARHFPRRNRIVSGLSQGVVVVEAALHSGSLITARLANEQGRDVFAVPGSPLDARCRGTNDLIRQGATLVESAQDVLDVLRPLLPDQPRLAFKEEKEQELSEVAPLEPQATDDLRRRVLENLGPSPVPVDALVRTCQAPTGSVLSVLLELELAGRLHRLSGGQVALVGI